MGGALALRGLAGAFFGWNAPWECITGRKGIKPYAIPRPLAVRLWGAIPGKPFVNFPSVLSLRAALPSASCGAAVS